MNNNNIWYKHNTWYKNDDASTGKALFYYINGLKATYIYYDQHEGNYRYREAASLPNDLVSQNRIEIKFTDLPKECRSVIPIVKIAQYRIKNEAYRLKYEI